MTSVTPMTRTATFRAHEVFELRSLDAVRVAPASARELEAGPDGLEVLAFGLHSPGDGESVADWWTT